MSCFIQADTGLARYKVGHDHFRPFQFIISSSQSAVRTVGICRYGRNVTSTGSHTRRAVSFALKHLGTR
jgi:hypothetical protein